MATSTIVWVIVAIVVAVLVIAVVAFVARNARNRRRHAEGQRIRSEAEQESLRVQKREALADETAAKARAAKAEAEAKAAEAARLEERATSHRTKAASSRDQLNEQFEHADSLDPTKRPTETDTPDEEVARSYEGDAARSYDEPVGRPRSTEPSAPSRTSDRP
ncbi:MAG: hypothetical protein JWR37_323 [Mycobacterium sp.]|jgi:FtsZ-interacting cell division protein ZipA|nr:hypothetical protein [Mycobacterium sp.]